MEIYAILAQGSNEYYDDPQLHVSKNHISLNSIGLPFAQIMAIEKAARDATRLEEHGRMELYLDEDFYHSLNFDFKKFDKNEQPSYRYIQPIASGEGYYFCASLQTIISNLASPRTKSLTNE